MCSHLRKSAAGDREPVTPSSAGCKECLEDGDSWVHLRLCLTCGHVGCCDDSPNRHATGHFHATTHPVIKSFEPGEEWAWCFVHEEMIESVPTFSGESPRRHYASPGDARP
jgi:thioredoxin reductase (NADPH)